MKVKTKALIFLIMLTAMLSALSFAVSAEAVSGSAEPVASELAAKETGYVIEQGDGIYSAASETGIITDNSLSELISRIDTDGAVITFAGVSTNEALIFKSSVTLTGELDAASGMSLSGKNVTLEDVSFNIASGMLRIKSGSTTLLSGDISLGSGASVALDFSSSAQLFIKGGKIAKSAVSPAIVCSLGSIDVSGGEIVNLYGAAIENRGTLTLGGSPLISGYNYGVLTDRAIHLSSGDVGFSGELTVMYDTRFAMGSFTAVMLDVPNASSAGLSLLDVTGESMPLTYFDSTEYSEEKKLFAVYLPYRADFYVGNELYLTDEFLSGEAFACPTAPERFGYTFFAWCKGSPTGEPYSFGTGESADISLYAAFSLSKPAFSLSSVVFTYDGEYHSFGFDSLTHPLGEEGSFSFVWYKDGAEISSSSEHLTVRDVSDSGSYFCKLTFSYNGDFVTVETSDVTLTIKRCTVKLPEIPSVYYSGEIEYPTVLESQLYTYEMTGAVNVGRYDIKFTLKDSENYAWDRSEGAEGYSAFEILRAENTFLSVPTVSDTFLGSLPRISCAVKFGEAEYHYSEDGISFSCELPSKIGSYYLKIIVNETENYTGISSELLVFLIIEEVAVGIKIDTLPTKTEYIAFDVLVLDGAEFTVTYNSGKSEQLSYTQVSVSYREGDCFLAQDTCATVSYLGVSVPVPVTVRAASYDISGIIFENTERIYSGKRHSITPMGTVVGKDGIPLEYEVLGGGITVGEYEVRLTFRVSSPNYSKPNDVIRVLNIKPMRVTVSYSDTEFVYDGSPKLPHASFISAEGALIEPTVSGAATDAGEYTARVIIDDVNYIAENPTVSFTVKRADIDVSQIVWSESVLTYNGAEQSVRILSLPDCLEVVGYANAKFTDAGAYYAVATVSYDERNYNVPSVIACEWQIIPADYDMSSFGFYDSEYVYDGNIHYPKPMGNPPIGSDGRALSYTFSGGATHVSEGRVLVRIVFSTESKNYNTPDPVSVYVKILPRSITVSWGEVSFIYNGSYHVPLATAAECEINVTGGGTDAGEYVACASPASSDYKISNAKVVFTVAKAENRWLRIPSVLDIYESGTLCPTAESLYGEVGYKYFADAAMQSEIPLPHEGGIYYLVAYVSEGDNYLALSSDPCEFSIIKVAPKELSVKLVSETLYAMQTLGDGSFEAYYINNDGSYTSINPDDVTVSYESADALRAADDFITFSCGELTCRVKVKVKRASYDMSSVKWVGNFHTYDGEQKIATLEGLPEGVTLVRYITNSATEAGSYKLSALLDYDKENYAEPEIPEAWLVINKKVLTLPEIEGATYNGNSYTPTVQENPLYAAVAEIGTAAGEYAVSFTLTDSENYEFADGISVVTYKIEKRKLTLAPNDNADGYTVLSGDIVPGDELGEEYYTEGGYVYLRISNPNYSVTVEPIKERSGFALLLIIILLILLVCLGIYIFFNHRERVLLFVTDTITRIKRCSERTESEASDEAAEDASDNGEPILETLLAVDEAHANSLISDNIAKSLLTDSKDKIRTNGRRRCIVNVDTICESFSPGERVDINSMKEKGIIPADAKHVKVLARGVMDKPLKIIANAFSLSAVKMIALTGGEAIRVRTASAE